MTNDLVDVYSKADCSLLRRQSLTNFFRGAPGGLPPGLDLYDPQVIFDELSQRCFLSANTDIFGPDPNPDQFLFFAVSTGRGCGNWNLYRITLSEAASSILFCKNQQADYWEDIKNGLMRANNGRWFISGNNILAGGGAEGRYIYIDKAPTLSGDATTVRCSPALQDNVAPPIVRDDNATAFFLATGSGSGSSVQRYAHVTTSADIDTDVPGTAATPIPVPAWTAPPPAPQPNGVTLDTLDGRFVGQTQQVGDSLWNVHTINVSGFARFRLYRFSQTGATLLASTTPTSLGANNDHLFNASVAINLASNLAFVTASRTIPTNATAGKAAMLILKGQALTLAGFTTPDTPKISTAQYNDCVSDPCLWEGTATQLDPSNPTRAWSFNQFIKGNNDFNWDTFAARVR